MCGWMCCTVDAYVFNYYFCKWMSENKSCRQWGANEILEEDVGKVIQTPCTCWLGKYRNVYFSSTRLWGYTDHLADVWLWKGAEIFAGRQHQIIFRVGIWFWEASETKQQTESTYSLILRQHSDFSFDRESKYVWNFVIYSVIKGAIFVLTKLSTPSSVWLAL